MCIFRNQFKGYILTAMKFTEDIQDLVCGPIFRSLVVKHPSNKITGHVEELR